jgi:ABC-type polysaccharide/polyol phosphate export permease
MGNTAATVEGWTPGLLARIVDRLVRRNPLRVFVTYRSFIWRSALADLRYRYVGSSVGVFWNVLIPLAQIAIYTAVFSGLMPMPLRGAGYAHGFAVYLCSGLLPWVGFSECITRGTHSFVENAAYLKKLPIPEQVFVACNAVAATLGLGLSMILLAVATLALGGRIAPAWASIVLVILLLQCVGFGLGLALGSLNVFFRDVGQALGIALQMWMWLTPIVYVKEVMPASLRGLQAFNPAYPFVDVLHRIVLWGQWPNTEDVARMGGWAVAATLAGFLLLRKLRPEIRDVL